MPTGDSSDRGFTHLRFIDATPEQVAQAFAQPERLVRWWGPQGTRSSLEAFDLRPGGKPPRGRKRPPTRYSVRLCQHVAPDPPSRTTGGVRAVCIRQGCSNHERNKQAC